MLLLVGANIIWGTSHGVAKVAMETFPPQLLAALRFILATGLIWIVVLASARTRRELVLAPADLRRVIGVGLCGMALGYLFSYWGLSWTTATDSALLIISEVIFTSLLAAWLAREVIGRWKGAGILLGALGVVILVLNSATSGDGAQSGLWRALGDLLVMTGLFCEAVYSVLGAGVARRVQPLVLLAYAFAASLLLWIPVLAWYSFGGRFPTVTPTAALGVVYLAVLPSVVCNFIWFAVIRHVGASLAALSLFVQPVVGSLLGVLLLGERVTPSLLLGGGLIFLALYLTTIPERPASLPASLERAS